MSSRERSTSPPTSNKRRRLPAACDRCKERKVRCDSGQMPANRCSNCIYAGIKCTHLRLTQSFRSAKGYAENLELRLEKMEQLLKKLAPGMSLNFDNLDDISLEPEKVLTLACMYQPQNGQELDMAPILRNGPDSITGNSSDSGSIKVVGKSSAMHLIQTALSHTHLNLPKTKQRLLKTRREEFWELRPWQSQCLSDPPDEPYSFPPDDLLHQLIDLYFRWINNFFPVLSRVILLRDVQAGLHLTDRGFGGVLLLVCALGARWSNDPRVLLSGVDEPNSAGWKWFIQVPRMKFFYHAKICVSDRILSELQICALSAIYKQMAIPGAHGNWVDIGSGLRIALDAGCHRNRPPSWPTPKNELWKRAFFVLLSIDRKLGLFKGRPTSVLDEEYDLDFPVECDDEYWEMSDPDSNFIQPPGKPSLVSGFVHYLKLMDILAYTMRTLYACKKPTMLTRQRFYPGVQETVVEIESALNEWLNALPSHLQWDPNREHDVFFEQSALLYLTYYHLQITIHKPFIPSPQAPSPPQTFPSLTICTNAARSCARIAKSLSGTPIPHLVLPLFSSAIILLLSSWSKLRAGANYEGDMTCVQTCMDVFGCLEQTTSIAGRLWDIMAELKTIGQTCLAQSDFNDTDSADGCPCSTITIPHNEPPRAAESALRSSTTLQDSTQNRPDNNSCPNYWENIVKEVSSVEWPLTQLEPAQFWSTMPSFDNDDWGEFLNSFAEEWNF